MSYRRPGDYILHDIHTGTILGYLYTEVLRHDMGSLRHIHWRHQRTCFLANRHYKHSLWNDRTSMCLRQHKYSLFDISIPISGIGTLDIR